MRQHILPPLFSLVFVSAAQLPAASIDGSFQTTTQSTTWDLTELGVEDWQYWSVTASSFDGTATNSKDGGTDLLSNLYAVGGGGLRGTSSTSLTDLNISYTDGVSPVSDESVLRGAFNTQLSTSGAGVGLDIVLPTTDTYVVNIFTGGFYDSAAGSVGTFTASLNGATSYIDSSLVSTTSAPKASIVYTLLVTPDNANDVLSVSMVLANRGGSNGSQHTFMGAATIALVPEPSTYPMLAGAVMLGFVAIRRRRRQ